MKTYVLALWTGQTRPTDTIVALANDGTLRIAYREQWIQVDAPEFIETALYVMGKSLARAKPMARWAEGLTLADDARIGFKSSANEATHHADIGYLEKVISLEEFSVDLKTICVAVARLMDECDQFDDIIDIIRSIWWH